MSFDFRSVGGVPLMQSNPDGSSETVWNFGYYPTPAYCEEYHSTPSVHAAIPQIVGKWDGKTSISHWDATKLVKGYWPQGEYLPAQRQPRGTCFPAGTSVLMADGTEKSIEKVKVGDEVVTHLNRLRKVLETGERCFTGAMCQIKVKGMAFPVWMTEEHPVAVFPNVKKEYDHGYKPGPVQWIEAGQVVPDNRVLLPFGLDPDKEQIIDLADYLGKTEKKKPAVGQPLVTEDKVRAWEGKLWCNRFIKVNTDFCRLLGLYLAEGSVSGNRTELTMNTTTKRLLAEEAATLIRDIFGVNVSVLRDKSRDSVLRVRCGAAVVGRFFKKLCGTGALRKRLPKCILRAPKKCRLAVLRGWLDGDGCVRNENLVVGVTSSHKLHKGLFRLSLSCGLKPNGGLRKQAEYQNAAATDLSYTCADAIRLYPKRIKARERSGTGFQYARSLQGFLCKVESILFKQVTAEKVYNLEVEEDHSYVAGGVAVHNCVARGGSGALNVRQCIQIALLGAAEEFKPVSHSALYGEVRELGGITGNSDGAMGADAAKALARFGAVHQQEAGEAVGRGGYYSDDLAVKWGAGRGGMWTPPEVKKLGSDNPALNILPVRTSEEAADVIAAGGTVTVASDQGFTTTRDGLGMCRPSGTWMHQMYFAAVIVLPDGRKVFGCGQSWGDNEPSGPLLWHCPDYVFGVDWDAANRMLRQGDSMGIPAFDGWDVDVPVIPWAERSF